MSERYLHIGCGSNILPPPFENLDIRELPGVDHVSPVDKLSFEDDVFDLVYASHVLEHVNRSETQPILREWIRIIKPGGTLRLSVPSFENLIEIYQQDKKLSNVIGPLIGGQTYDENFHFNVFDKDTLAEYMKSVGLIAIHPWDYRRTEHSGYWDFSQALTNGISISINLEGRKGFKNEPREQYLHTLYSDLLGLYEANIQDKEKTKADVLSVLSRIIGDD